MMIQVDKGVPMPPHRPMGRPTGGCGKHRYPWRTMQIGDSFVYPGETYIEAYLRAYRATHGRKTYDPHQYEIRTVDTPEGKVVRIWRIA